MKADIQTLGHGSRISEKTRLKPKPMIEIADKPIFWHVMQIYSSRGVNKLKLVYGAVRIDIWELFEAAKTKLFGHVPFYFGSSFRGHCTPIDLLCLKRKERDFGQHSRFIELAGEINTSMLHHVVNVVFNVLNAKGKSVNGSRILLLGLAYKANVDDDRESPTYKPIEKLESLGVAVEFHDPYIPVTPKTREHAQYSSRKSVGKISDQYDLLLISTGHDEYRSHDFSAYKVPVVDTRNCVASKPTKYCKA